MMFTMFPLNDVHNVSCHVIILLMGKNLAPPGMVKTLLINNGIIIILGGAGFCPSTGNMTIKHPCQSSVE